MSVVYLFFERTFKDDSYLLGSYARTENGLAAGLPNLPTKENPILGESLQEIIDEYGRLGLHGNSGDDVDTIPMLRKIFAWPKIYFDSRVNQESLEEFRATMGIK